MSEVTVNELITQLKEFNDEDIVTIFTPNCPPWITEFSFKISTPEEVEKEE